MPDWITKLEPWVLYPMSWYVVAVDWLQDHPHAAFWAIFALAVLLVF